MKLNFTHMRTILYFRNIVMLLFLLLATVLTQAQTDKKAIELKRLETNLATAKAKVVLNERQLTVADSLITRGTQLTAESKTETKAIATERKKLDKDYATQQKSLTKLSNSKDKQEAIKARADLKALSTQYRLDSKALDVRLKDATKKSTTGDANLTKGKMTKTNARDALKISKASLEAAQKKYDDASASGENTATNKKKK
jgi:hypothetical protein